MGTKIDVTEEDIRLGKRNNSCECPIALAGTRAFGVACIVGLFIKPAGLNRMRLPHEAVKFINEFDEHGGLQLRPFSFEV